MRGRSGETQTISSRWLHLAGVGLLAIVLWASVYGLLSSALQVPSRYRIAHQGIRSEGWITAKEPQEHGGLVVYSFRVGNEAYGGEGGIGDRFENAKVGDRVSLIYDPYKPWISTLGKPYEQFWQSLALSVFVSFLCGAIGAGSVGFVLYHRRRKTLRL
jgi:hypothetical protein